MQQANSDWKDLTTVFEKIRCQGCSIKVKCEETVGFVNRVDLQRHTQLCYQLTFSRAIGDKIEFRGLAQKLYKALQLLVLRQFLHEGCNGAY